VGFLGKRNQSWDSGHSTKNMSKTENMNTLWASTSTLTCCACSRKAATQKRHCLSGGARVRTLRSRHEKIVQALFQHYKGIRESVLSLLQQFPSNRPMAFIHPSVVQQFPCSQILSVCPSVSLSVRNITAWRGGQPCDGFWSKK
jgi:hypothetical protein